MREQRSPNSHRDAAGVVDERVVRQLLRVNASLRQGRTTGEVKRALERGEPLTPTPAVVAEEPTIHCAAVGLATEQLGETIGFFVRGKRQELDARLGEIERRRRALDEEARRARYAVREQLVAFVALLDARQVDLHGATVWQPHRDFLAELELNPATLVAQGCRRRG